jgi:hypothetical protein
LGCGPRLAAEVIGARSGLDLALMRIIGAALVALSLPWPPHPSTPLLIHVEPHLACMHVLHAPNSTVQLGGQAGILLHATAHILCERMCSLPSLREAIIVACSGHICADAAPLQSTEAYFLELGQSKRPCTAKWRENSLAAECSNVAHSPASDVKMSSQQRPVTRSCIALRHAAQGGNLPSCGSARQQQHQKQHPQHTSCSGCGGRQQRCVVQQHAASSRDGGPSHGTTRVQASPAAASCRLRTAVTITHPETILPRVPDPTACAAQHSTALHGPSQAAILRYHLVASGARTRALSPSCAPGVGVQWGRAAGRWGMGSAGGDRGSRWVECVLQQLVMNGRHGSFRRNISAIGQCILCAALLGQILDVKACQILPFEIRTLPTG